MMFFNFCASRVSATNGCPKKSVRKKTPPETKVMSHLQNLRFLNANNFFR